MSTFWTDDDAFFGTDDLDDDLDDAFFGAEEASLDEAEQAVGLGLSVFDRIVGVIDRANTAGKGSEADQLRVLMEQYRQAEAGGDAAAIAATQADLLAREAALKKQLEARWYKHPAAIVGFTVGGLATLAGLVSLLLRAGGARAVRQGYVGRGPIRLPSPRRGDW